MNAESTEKAPTPIVACVPAARPIPLRYHARRPGVLIEHTATSSRRREVEEFIRAEFREHFGANIRHFMPQLIALHGPRGDLRAAVGCRSAAAEKLFLETYTITPIERVIATRLGVDVPRAQIVEVGSLACVNGRAATEIVTGLIPALINAGFTWVVFTGADTVRNVFHRLNLVPFALCAADQSLLGAEQHDWGSYYDHNPIVMTGRLVDGLHVVETLPGVQ
jgi:hypothetical protein